MNCKKILIRSNIGNLFIRTRILEIGKPYLVNGTYTKGLQNQSEKDYMCPRTKNVKEIPTPSS
jgi:hypothetical protein